MSGGERPMGAAKGKQTHTRASCQAPPPPPRPIWWLLEPRVPRSLPVCGFLKQSQAPCVDPEDPQILTAPRRPRMGLAWHPLRVVEGGQ